MSRPPAAGQLKLLTVQLHSIARPYAMPVAAVVTIHSVAHQSVRPSLLLQDGLPIVRDHHGDPRDEGRAEGLRDRQPQAPAEGQQTPREWDF